MQVNAERPASWQKRLVRHLRPPYLDLRLDIGLLQIQTELMTERYEQMCRNYIALRITLLHKWGGHFRLYSPYRP